MRGTTTGDLPSASVSLIVDAYERLGGRVLNRMRDLREDLDGDLAELRSELASLRTAVEDVADRVQLRQMRSSIDELRSDVAGLRRAVLEWPELERVASDVSALRAATTDLQQSLANAATKASPKARDDGARRAIEERVAPVLEELRTGLAELQSSTATPEWATEGLAEIVLAELADLRAAVTRPYSLTELSPLVEELGELRTEMAALRHRIALRAATTEPALGPDELAAIAEAVTERLLQVIRPV